jgi:predicted dehydrogenase
MVEPSVLRLPKVMVDATVLIAGSAFPRWPHEVLRHALKGDFTLAYQPTGEEGRADLAVVRAAMESAETGRAVTLPA